MSSRSNDWHKVGSDLSYWNPENAGINGDNSKFVCGTCAVEVPFDWVCECGRKDNWVLGRGSGLPGIFCQNCGDGRIAWTCPACNSAQRLFLVFYYDASQLTVKKRTGFFSRLFGSKA
jgi:hypothetical protein